MMKFIAVYTFVDKSNKFIIHHFICFFYYFIAGLCIKPHKKIDVSRETSISFRNNDFNFEEFSHIALCKFCVFLQGFYLIKRLF